MRRGERGQENEADNHSALIAVVLAASFTTAQVVYAQDFQKGLAATHKGDFATASREWRPLSCCSFAANAVRPQLHGLAYNLANFMRTLALPGPVSHWSLTSLREKLVKIGAKIVAHSRYVTFQMTEVAVPGDMFAEILRLIAQLRAPPALA